MNLFMHQKQQCKSGSKDFTLKRSDNTLTSFGEGILGGSVSLFVKVADGEGSKGLHEASSVVGTGCVSRGKHLLRKLAVEVSGSVGKVGLNVNKLLDVVEGTVHLQNLNFTAEEAIGTGGELDTGVGAAKLLAAGSPLDGGALVE